MSKLFVEQVVNGNASVVAEFSDNEQAAKVSFHQTAAALWNAPDVIEANLKILNEHLDTFEGYSEYIYHAEEPAPEP